MRYLIFFIIVFLLIRWISNAYLNRPSVRGPRSTRDGKSTSSRDSGSSNRFGHVEDADYEILDEDDTKEKKEQSR